MHFVSFKEIDMHKWERWMAKAKKNKVPPHMQRDAATRKRVEGTRRERAPITASGGRDIAFGDPGFDQHSESHVQQ
jgi:hypothetical protein